MSNLRSTARRRGASTLSALAALALAGALGACDSAFDVTNPNQLGQADLERPEASAALVNGAEATAARALAQVLFPLGAASDDLVSIGGYDASRELDQGYLSNTGNEFTSSAFEFLSEARFSADQAIRQLGVFDAAGALGARPELARAYLYGGIVYATIGDAFEDFVISSGRTAAPPIGAANMRQVYDTAVAYLDRGLVAARASGRGDLALAILAQRARTKHARAIWSARRARSASPLVVDSGATADAAEALTLATQPDWKLRLTYGPTTVANQLASWVNVRQELRASDELVVPKADNKRAAGIRLTDAIDGRPDPALRTLVDEFVADPQFPPVTVVSARELRLIIAEAALAGGKEAEAARQLNALRALDGLTPWAGQVPLASLLRHARRVNLFLQGRRLADQYRFGIVDARWLPASDARRAPGTLLPIPDVERRANCHLAGTC